MLNYSFKKILQWCQTMTQITFQTSGGMKREGKCDICIKGFQGQQKVICLTEKIPHCVSPLTEESVVRLITILSSL